MTYVIFKNLAGSTSRNGSMSTTLSFLEIYTWSIRIKLNRKWSFLRKLCQTRTTINDPMRVKKGERIKNKIWYIWQIEVFCLEEVFAEKWISIGCFPFSAWGQIGIKIVRFDPLPKFEGDLKYLLDTGTIRLLMACSLDHS